YLRHAVNGIDLGTGIPHASTSVSSPEQRTARRRGDRLHSSMANLITLSRLLLLFVVVAIAYAPSSWLKLIDIPLLIFVFVTDGLDGHVARKRGEASQFGAMFDISVDRIVELSLWVVFTHLDLVSVWVPLVFVVRGSIVDVISG